MQGFWFKCYGTPFDERFLGVSVCAKTTVGAVANVWTAIMFHQARGGTVETFDPISCDMFYRFKKGTSARVLEELRKSGLQLEIPAEEPAATRTENHGRLDISHAEWRRLRLEVFERDAYTCAYCGVHVDHPHCDHIFPLSLGGKSVLENLTTACPACNTSKSNKTLAEWRGN